MVVDFREMTAYASRGLCGVIPRFGFLDAQFLFAEDRGVF
jgi:hypothetical protein